MPLSCVFFITLITYFKLYSVGFQVHLFFPVIIRRVPPHQFLQKILVPEATVPKGERLQTFNFFLKIFSYSFISVYRNNFWNYVTVISHYVEYDITMKRPGEMGVNGRLLTRGNEIKHTNLCIVHSINLRNDCSVFL